MKYFVYIIIIVVFDSCKRTNCNNRIKDGSEKNIDCGGSCPECPPTVSTTSVSTITYNSAYCGMIYNGNVSQRFDAIGLCYATSHNPTTDSNLQVGYYGTFDSHGDYRGTIQGLNPNTTYYVRGFASTDVGTAYGNELSLTTPGDPVTITTTPITITSSTLVYSGGNIVNLGIATILKRGICWSTYENPTIADSKTIDGSGPGNFVSTLIITSTPTILYYVRAYATNSDGWTTYGNQVSAKF